MTRSLLRTDRLATLVVGLVLVVLGLGAIDWQTGQVLSYRDALDTGPASTVVESAWWPWAFAGAGLLLAVVGLWWLLAHLRREGPGVLRLRSSDETGRTEADLRSVAAAAADRLATLAPVTGAKGTTKVYRSHTVVELRAHVDEAADPATLTEAVATCTADVSAAFSEDDVTCRVLLEAPRRSRTGRTQRVRVR